MSSDRLSYLFHRHLVQACTPAERKELFVLAMEAGNQLRLKELMEQSWNKTGAEEDMAEAVAANMLSSIISQKTKQQPVKILRWLPYAAAVILLLTTGVYFYFHGRNTTPVAAILPATAIVPGGNKALLTLNNGTTIELNDAAAGTLAHEGSTAIIKLDGGILAYNMQQDNGNSQPLYNTISTPRGGQYQVILADGTKVWLNAASSLRFPASFHGKRQVSVTGEAYFEVASDARNPFYVSIPGSQIQVLGTSFNVNAYPDEHAFKTSLLEGVIKIGQQVLLPGQAYCNGQVFATNTEQDIAWKKGLFNFRENDLAAAMRQIARWYNVDIVYRGEIPRRKFWGDLQRSLQLSEVLGFLHETGINFKMEGRCIIVTP